MSVLESTHWGWFLGMVIGSAMAFSGNCAQAQITPDRTLPNNSNVTQEGSIFNINGGTQAGRNLFHSFGEFSVPTRSEARFNNAFDIQNIFSRVTGKSVSDINGLISVQGTANLFLINPNGIVFGPNASLNVGGSFVASTANSLKFADGTEFNATATQSTPMLTISVPIGLQFGTNPGLIQVQGDGQGLRSTSDLIDTTTGLRVQPNQALALIGGDLSLEGATLKTAGGRIELGSVGGNSLVRLTPINKGFSLGYSEVQNFGSIQLSQQAAIDASGEGGGDIQVQGGQVKLTDGSQVEASTLGSKPGGTLVVRAFDSVDLIGKADGKLSTGFVSEVYQGATGTGGNIILETGRLNVQDGAEITLDTLGAGSAGNLRIETGQLNIRNGAQVSDSSVGEGSGGTLAVKAFDSVQVVGTDAASNPSGLFTVAQGTGAAGNLTIDTGTLIIQDGAQVTSATSDKGSAGNLTIKASDSVKVIGFAPDRMSPSILSSSTVGNGLAGNLTIDTGKLIIQNGAQVSTGPTFGFFVSSNAIPTGGTGRGGDLSVKATDSVQMIETAQLLTPRITPTGSITRDLLTTASALSSQSQGTGAAGNLTIETGRLIIQDGAQVSTSTQTGKGLSGGTLAVTAKDSVEILGTALTQEFPSGLFTETKGSGAAGSLTMTTERLIVQNGGQVSTSTFSDGAGGNLTVNALKSVELTGTSANNRLLSSLLTQTQGGGRAGDLKITTEQLIIQNGALASSSTRIKGAGGNLSVKASSVELKGTTPNRQFNSGLFTQTQSVGDAGDLTISTGNLTVQDGASVSAQTFGRGQGGNLTIAAGQFFVQDNAAVTVSSLGIGKAGSLNITANSIRQDNQARILATAASGNGGNIFLTVRDLLLLRRRSQVSTTAGTAQAGGNGGDITIYAPNGFIVAVPRENSGITANAFSGSGGKVKINTTGIFGLTVLSREDLVRLLGKNDLTQIDFQQLPSSITAISQTNPTLNGQVNINTPDIDPSQGLVQLSTNLVDTTQQIDTSCNPGSRQRASSFTVTGRGGLPSSPDQILAPKSVLVDWVTLNPSSDNHNSSSVTKKPTKPTTEPIVQATGWIKNAKGEVVLVANASTVTPHSSQLTPASCQMP